MTEPAPAAGAEAAIDIPRYMASLRHEVAAGRISVGFAVARRPGSGWLSGLKRKRRRRRARDASGSARFKVSLRALLRLDGSEFIQKAYVRLLGRRADPTGHAIYLSQLTGTKSRKIKVLAALRESGEGRALNIRMPGLDFAIWWNKRFPHDARLSELLFHDGRDFVLKAHEVLLGRQPDPADYALRLQMLRNGRRGKIRMLRELCDSGEGRVRKARVRWLDFAIWWDERFPRRARLGDLLSHDGRDFVLNAHEALLGREPDPVDYAARLPTIGHGRRGKLLLLKDLVDSSEGRARDVHVRWLDVALWWDKQFPVGIGLRDMLRHDGSDFIRNAYSVLLGREPDAADYAPRLSQTESAADGKILLLRELCESAEGRARSARVRGLAFALWRDRRFPPVPRLRDMLRYDGPDFVRNAYSVLLGREPDAADYAPRLSQTESGADGKILLLRELCESAEGRAKNAHVRGLIFADRQKNLYQRFIAVVQPAASAIVRRGDLTPRELQRNPNKKI